ncbi:MAG: cysteine--tRNA ligase [Candidatus Omnitrophota bacterium]
MTIFIQNTLSGKKEEFIPMTLQEVKMYTCGVTVYDDCHVGHARSLFIFDCLKKYMEYRGFKVKLVRNITDVDDKIINRARQDGVSFEDIRTRYIKNYYRDLAAFEIDKADFEPLATENVHYMIDYIKQLVEKGNAYNVDGDVYFSVRSFSDYGRLSGQGMDEMLTAVRIEKDDKKKDPLDFALWKKSKEGEPSWKSPWGMGRPGWHIECSTMSTRFLRTQTMDIHAGGRDLVFPHHENEIAQAEALTGKKFAKYWIHHGLLTIDGKKMSKSLGNFVTIQDILKKYEPNVLKLFFLTAHYGSSMDFTYSGLDQTKKAYEKIGEFLYKIAVLKKDTAAVAQKEADALRQKFESAMDDDFNTAKALAVIFELLALGNKYLIGSDTNAAAVYTSEVLTELAKVLGLNLKTFDNAKDISSAVRIKFIDPCAAGLNVTDIENLLEERRKARCQKDFKKADEIRDLLKRQGIKVEDKEKS